jgi:hypothetical protein
MQRHAQRQAESKIQNMSISMLTNDDSKPWAPLASVMRYVENVCSGSKILDVGAGHIPFPKATHTVDLVPKARDNVHSTGLNLRHSKIPFDDKYFDFVFCRHTAEDMDDPLGMLQELARVGKRGYIETPSPLAEMCRGIDGGSPPWRGYNHHRHLIWATGNTIKVLPKLPQVEYMTLDDERYVKTIKEYPALANTYMLWDDNFEIKFIWDEILLNYEKGVQGPSYQQAVAEAVEEGMTLSGAFLSRLAMQA